MDRVDELRAFASAVDRGSLSAAARALGRSPASVTRAIASLEGRLGTALLQRTTRSLRLTEAGERYVVVARRVLTDLDDAERSTATDQAEPHGTLTITAPLAFGSLHVRPLVDAFLAKHANVRARLLLLDRVVSVVEEGVDVAVRIAHLADSALLATAVGSVRRVVVASPEYLARYGRPRTPAALAAHRCVATIGVAPGDVWTFKTGPGSDRKTRVHLRPVFTVNVAESAVRSAMSGVGLACVLSYQVAGELSRGALVRVLGQHEPPPLPVHLVYPAAVARTAKVRAFIDLAAPRLRALLAGQAASRRA